MDYSIDMVRLRGRFSKDFLNRFFASSVFSVSPNIRGWISKDVRGFRYNYSILDSSGAGLWLGCMHNSEDVRSDSTWVYAEYNPNKFDVQDVVVPGQVRGLLRHMAICGELVLVHLALDIYEGIDRFIVDKFYKHSYKFFHSRKGKTYYVGEYGHGYMKVYEKGKEQGVDYDWTRIEYVLRYDSPVDCLPLIDFRNFPRVYRIKGDCVDPVVRALVHAIGDGVVEFSDLSRSYKRRVREACELVRIDGKRVDKLVWDLLTDIRNLPE